MAEACLMCRDAIASYQFSLRFYRNLYFILLLSKLLIYDFI